MTLKEEAKKLLDQLCDIYDMLEDDNTITNEQCHQALNAIMLLEDIIK